MLGLAGSIAVVTGAASGLGREVARALVRRGCVPVLVDRDGPSLDAAATELRPAAPGLAAHRADITHEAAVRHVAEEVGAMAGSARSVRILVNNAATSAIGPFERTPTGDLREVMETNFWGAVHCTRAFLPLLRAGAPSCIVNIISLMGLMGLPSKSAYTAAKFALRGLGECLRSECHGSGVRVVEVYPPGMDTPIVRQGLAVDPAARDAEAALLARYGKPVPKVAERIVRAAERGRPRVFVGWDTRLSDWLVRASPAAVRAIGRTMARRPPFGAP